MKIRFNTMKKEKNPLVTIKVEPIKHLIITNIYNKDNIYSYGYMQEENRLFVQYMEGNIPDAELHCFDDIDTHTFYLLEQAANKQTFIKGLYKNRVTFLVPLLDVWCGNRYR